MVWLGSYSASVEPSWFLSLGPGDVPVQHRSAVVVLGEQGLVGGVVHGVRPKSVGDQQLIEGCTCHAPIALFQIGRDVVAAAGVAQSVHLDVKAVLVPSGEDGVVQLAAGGGAEEHLGHQLTAVGAERGDVVQQLILAGGREIPEESL